MGTETNTLRDAHRDLTRTRILEALVAEMQDATFDVITNAQIAARAGITERTFYRHFPTREALELGLWEWFSENRLGRRRFPTTPEEAIAFPGPLFEGFDREEAMVRWFVSSRKGQEIRLMVNEERKEAYLSVARLARPDLDEAAQRRLAGVVQLLDGSFAWQSLKDYWDLDAAESAHAVSEVIEILLRPKTEARAADKQTRTRDSKK